MDSAVGVKIGVAIETGHTKALVFALAVLGLIELLLRKWRQQKLHSFELNRRHKSDHQLVVIFEQLAMRHVTELRMRRQKMGGGNSGVNVSGRSKSMSNRRRFRPS